MNRIISLFLLLLCNLAYANPVSFEPNIRKLLVLQGPVDDHYKMAASVIVQSAITGDKSPIDILISSDGGMIEAGSALIVAIEFAKAKQVPVRCVNMSHVASMAFMIFMHCSERYAIPGAGYMFHYPKQVIQGVVTKDQLRMAAKQLDDLENAFVKDLGRRLHVPEKVVRANCDQETWWTTQKIDQLSPGFVKEVQYVSGVKIEPAKG